MLPKLGKQLIFRDNKAMNTSAVAQNLASRGRNGDTTLVHMTPDEVQGLQALAMAQGGSLTINPETGLPEASFLSDTFKAIAPTLIGAGLTYFTGMPAWAAGLTVGGVEAARQDDLGAGIMAGLGAYGGAGMANSFTAMGTPPNAAGGLKSGPGGIGLKGSTDFAPIDYSLTSDPIAGSFSGPTGGMDFGPNVSNFGNVGNVGDVVQPLNPTYSFDSVGSGTGFQMPSDLSMNTENIVPIKNIGVSPETSRHLSDVTRSDLLQSGGGGPQLDELFYRAPPTPNPTLEGVKQTFTGDGGFGRFKDAYVAEMGGPKQALLGGAGVLGSVADGYGAFDYKPMELAKAETDDYGYEGPYLPAERNVRFRGRDAILGGEGREFKFFDPVNPVPNVRTAAHGGLMSAKKMAVGGRYLDGPGDGVSDSIPATVDGEQPVLLSEGEYIIPAEVVSAVGNGSSDAGADKFTALVDTIMAKTRKVAKGKPNGADKLLKGLVPQTA